MHRILRDHYALKMDAFFFKHVYLNPVVPLLEKYLRLLL